jgi:amino acid adenylation domain-containing protein/non-ribosomal peptide synthase protein (TIGR01720 family)
MPSHQQLAGHLRESLSRLTGIDPAEIDGGGTFLDMGADSLTLLQISQTVQESCGVKVPFRLLMDDLSTVDALADHLVQRLPPETALRTTAPTPGPVAAIVLPAPAATSSAAPAVALPTIEPAPIAAPAPAAVLALPADGFAAILSQQIDFLGQQLELLRLTCMATPLSALAPVVVAAPPAAFAPSLLVVPRPAAKVAHEEETEFVPYKSIRRTPDEGLTPGQRDHLAALIARINAKTPGSKRIVENDRVHHADSRVVAGFRRLWKDLCYPLVVTEGYGGRVRDVDGNEYVDLTMGFGALLFGHSPPFVLEALKREVPRGVRLGPQSPLAGEVARLIVELTGVERVAFCNSGTEAVMTALRLARAHTGRDKVAIFSGSYHGTADEVLTRAEAGENGGRALPLAPGIPPSALADMVVFRYDQPSSLAGLRRQSRELAAVLVEPPRSRSPDVRPVEFLRELRRLTEESGALLIFDEIVTGFRTHPGGAQAIFGISADLVTYGKTLAGGMPIGVVAGKAAYMDAVDGGAWQFGDDSMPEVEMTFHAGTFCKHPYTMAVAKAVLEHLKAAGPGLQMNLNRRADELVRCLNDFFQAEDYPFKVVNFGSLFRFVYPPSLRLGELFFYHLLERGVFVWEGRNCFLSTAHTDADIAQITAAVKASAAALREGGILPPPARADGACQEPAAAGEAAVTFPLTEAQEQLWILTQLGAESSRAYNESMTLSLRGALDVEALRRAWAMVVARHAALRTRFAPDGGHQRFAPPGPVDLPLVELAAAPGDRQARIAAWIGEEARQVFDDLSGSPLYRARLLAVEEGWHLLVLTLHHLVTDGYSNGVVLRELEELYGALARGVTEEQAAARLPVSVPYSRYLARQLDERRGSGMERAETYWRDLFASPVPFLDLPTDRPRPPLQGHFGDRASLTVAPVLTARVRAFAKQQGCTLFITLLAAYQALLHRLSGQSDIVVGTPAAGQVPAGGGSLVGYCVNLLPLRSRPLPETTMGSHLKQVRAQVLDAYEHQAYPFQRLLKRIDLPRDASRLPLVAVTFTIERAARCRFPGLETELVSNNNGGSKFELFLTVVETDDGLVFDCEYNAYLFVPATLERWLGHLRQLLSSMVEAPHARLLDLPLLTPAERHQVVVEWNDTAAPYDRETLIHQLFEAQVERAPDAPAVDFAESRLTYRELNAEANRLAHVLALRGVGRGRPVAILLDRSLAMVPALLGVLKAGGAYVPLDPGHPAERIHCILATHEISVVITKASELATLAVLERRLPALAHVIALDLDPGSAPSTLGRAQLAGRAELAAQPVVNLAAGATAGDVAYLIFTSGSTGTPKGVVETHRPVVNLIRWVNGTFGVGAADRVLFITALTFDLSVYDVFGLLAAGGSIRVVAAGDMHEPERLLAWLAEDGITLWDSAPAALQQLGSAFGNAQPAGRAPHLRLVLLSGDWIPLALAARVRKRFPGAQVVAMGGATEATVWSNYHQVRDLQPHWTSIPYGRPIANARYYVLDAELAPAPLGVAGDLFIGGECLSSGYAREPGLTAARHLPDPSAVAAGARRYKTGDRARFLADGEIEFLGRLDTQVKIRGFRIELGEVETILAQHPALREAVVAVRSDAQGERRLVAFIVARAAAPAPPAIDELCAYLKQRLPEYMVPAAFVFLAALPVTANGKLDRTALPVPDFERPALSAGFEPPATPAEERLAVIWRQALGIAKVGRRDGFFELGGDSILAVRIVAQARRAGFSLTPADLFRYPTIAELASLADAAAAGDGTAMEREVPLTPIQRWFFERNLPHVEHYNQAQLLTVPAELSGELVERAFGHLVRHHEALRMRYERGAAGWRQILGPAEAVAVRCQRVDLTALTGIERQAAMTATCDRLQAGLDLERGSLVGLALLTCGGGEPQRLAIVIHHLAVDISSWQILLADLSTACACLRRGAAVEWRARTTTVREWTDGLASYARSAEVERQIPLLTAAARRCVRSLPRRVQSGENTVASERHVAVELDDEETRFLLRQAPRTFRALTQEVLLAALARAFGAWTGESRLLVDVEGNGREVELPGVNLAHTVGWFTTLYPVLLDLQPAASPRGDLQRVKEQLRALPQEGIGYGLLRYGERPEVARQLADLPPAEVSFLYLGGLAAVARESDDFAPAAESPGLSLAPSTPRSHLLEVYAAVAGGRLRTTFTYSENVHLQETIEQLAGDFLAALRGTLEDRGEPDLAVATPVDFPHADLSQDELDELLEVTIESR